MRDVPDQLDELARDYSAKHNLGVGDLAGLYRRTFSTDSEEEEEEDFTRRVTFNSRQRLVIVAEHISDEVEQTLRYLRTQFGADVTGLVFTVHTAGGDVLINTTMRVGQERQSNKGASSPPRARETDESILTRAKTDFVRDAVLSIEEWVKDAGLAGLTVDHVAGSEHYLRYMGKTLVWYLYAAGWLYMLLYRATEAEVEQLRAGLSKPDELKTGDTWSGGWRFHVAEPGDLEIIKSIVLARVPST